jgi:hypothetical protein
LISRLRTIDEQWSGWWLQADGESARSPGRASVPRPTRSEALSAPSNKAVNDQEEISMKSSSTLSFELSQEQEDTLAAIAAVVPEDMEQFEKSYRAWNAHFTEPGEFEGSYRAWNAHFTEPSEFEASYRAWNAHFVEPGQASL